jgi:hydroxymethylbilane synthase
MSTERTTINIGSRRSKLALIQTNEVKRKLEALFPHLQFKIYEQDTKGDKILDVALSKIGDKGLFTQELEQGLHDGSIDFAVHSLKDLPTTLPPGMTVGAILKREEPADVVVIRKDLVDKYKSLEELQKSDVPAHRTIGTSSLRRQAQLKRSYPNLTFADIRGNLDTRFRKLDTLPVDGQEGVEYGAMILAHAGLARQGDSYLARVSEILNNTTMHYAVGQGALAVECRENDAFILEMLSKLHHADTASCCVAERAFLGRLEGGCHVPVGVFTKLEGANVHLAGRVLSLDGSAMVEGETSGPREDAKTLGVALANRLLEQGADKILASLSQAH